MDFSSIKTGLEGFVERYDSQTFIGSYRETSRSSLLNEGLSTRANSLWKMAEYVVAKFDNNNTPISDYIKGWKQLAISAANQYLLLEEYSNSWGMYDSQGVRLGGNDYILEFLHKKKKERNDSLKKGFVSEPLLYIKRPLQQIFYGAPGTGKSNKIKEEVDDKGGIHFRVTFHPDSDYSTFVGCYKPISYKKNILDGNGISETQLLSSFFDSNSSKYNRMNKARYLYEALVHTKDIRDLGLDAQMISEKLKANGFSGGAYTTEATCMYNIYDWLKEDGYIVENKLSYEFCPQAFIKAYVEAWRKHQEGIPVYLIIEEINRGNCAQIFGDMFQLLDRDAQGFSRYEISPDTDLQEYIAQLGMIISGITDSKGDDISDKIASGDLMKLPNNLYIWATMNTSDQSLFPIDSAFKRRWDWVYIPIDSHKEDWYIRVGDVEYSWPSFLDKINDEVLTDETAEDKHLGFYFCKADDNIISSEKFVSKVLFYLWNDVFKVYGVPEMLTKGDKNMKFHKFYNNDGSINETLVAKLLDNIGVEKKVQKPPIESATNETVSATEQ